MRHLDARRPAAHHSRGRSGRRLHRFLPARDAREKSAFSLLPDRFRIFYVRPADRLHRVYERRILLSFVLRLDSYKHAVGRRVPDILSGNRRNPRPLRASADGQLDYDFRGDLFFVAEPSRRFSNLHNRPCIHTRLLEPPCLRLPQADGAAYRALGDALRGAFDFRRQQGDNLLYARAAAARIFRAPDNGGVDGRDKRRRIPASDRQHNPLP